MRERLNGGIIGLSNWTGSRLSGSAAQDALIMPSSHMESRRMGKSILPFSVIVDIMKW